MRPLLTAFIFIISFALTNAQILTANPAAPTAEDSVIIYYDATQGNQGLKDFNGDVYAHTGVITSGSSNSGDWKHAPTWGDNSAKYKLTRISPNYYKFTIKPSIKDFYGASESEKILKMAFVFRSADNSKEGKDVGNADIFYTVYEKGVNVVIDSPATAPLFAELNDDIVVKARSFNADSLFLYFGEALVTATDNDTLRYVLTADSYGRKDFYVIAKDSIGDTAVDSFYYIVNPPLTLAMPPSGLQDGINYTSETSVTLQLFAPNKNFVYVIGDFNNWQLDTAYYMIHSQDGLRWWLKIDNLTPQEEYGFQYYVVDDAEQIKIPDPYTEKALDPWNDGEIISKNIYPNLKPYPAGKTEELVSIIQTAKPAYQWEVTDFQRPPKEKLVIYELLMRDFLAAHDFKTLIDTLGYLQRLGINAIELMPVNEFEGNLSWGYNPSLYFCVDKYYGPETDFMKFIDEAHKRGIAVIMDMVLNQQAGQSPLVRLYNDGNYGSPTSDNPWFNTTATHPYSVFYDMNHESYRTQQFVDRVTSYWLTKYKVDGYRFDLSKGFTQKVSSDVSAWSQYDQSRINILKRMYDKIRAVDSTAYVILEHFADNNEEQVLSGYGMMLWGNLNGAYSEAAMGYSSDLSWGYYKNRQWTSPNLISYMESHDEERLMYKNLHYGNISGSYNIKDLNIGLGRIKLDAAFFFPIPGPKMLWEFGELGYDYSINYPSNTESSRTDSKPIRWDYYNNSERLKVYKVFQHLINLKKEYATFNAPDSVIASLNGTVKKLTFIQQDMDAYIIGNFGVTPNNAPALFPAEGMWYDYFTGDSLSLSTASDTLYLRPGEFRLYTNVKLDGPVDEGLLIGTEKIEDSGIPVNYALDQNYPNPFNPATSIRFHLPKSGMVSLKIYNMLGQEVKTLMNREFTPGSYETTWYGDNNYGVKVSSGVYLYRLESDGFVSTKKMLLLK